ncbi:MAG TPA: indolepyruvate ferredoxin oxidoreductase family protein [Myxococcota bacterium]|nr:indolepyruvate ferredoxin oxidoreductase family protein [Myxococcota bacterium]
MSAPLRDPDYQLADRYARASGRVYLTGVQALVRLPLLQRERDAQAGLRTAGFISGYRGSPLGTYDMALWEAKSLLEANDIRFEPGINEDLAATAVWGSQQATLYPGARYDGVFGIWYGKGPGVDRSCDALKHGNYAGSSPHGGVLVLAGDDPGAKSSSIAHQSEPALIHCGIPILNPASVQDYLDLGLLGFAMSRYAGCWVGMKCVTDTVESGASVEVGPERARIVIPTDPERPASGLHIGWTNYPLQVEARLYQQRLPAAQAFARANGIDRVALGGARRRLGIATTGKAYLDVRQALDELGIDDALTDALGLCIYKVALVWPLEPQRARQFAAGLEELLVVEEKRPLLEEQLARLLYDEPSRPRLLGKRDLDGRPLVPSEGELAPGQVVAVLRRWLERCAPELASRLRPSVATAAPAAASSLVRLPAFCSGCPHNRSTVVPEGSLAQGGIGCHGMAVWLPERRTLAVTQMGGEGANWIGASPFTDTPHIFQNLGDGTYFHSGLLAIRAAVAAKVTLTYKILVNGAVAMTGGQPIEGEALSGEITVPEIARQLRAEGVARIAVVGDAPDKYPETARFPDGVTFHHRDSIDAVQRELRLVKGVSALIYDQTCAAEARRLRKRGEFPDPDERVVINERVCEGCGDCSVQSNCIAIEPVETDWGRKRRINQSSCNKDRSCLLGHCPSFVSVHGGRLRRAESGRDAGGDALFRGLPAPAEAELAEPWNVLVTGIGGSGVITVGALLGMAAHLEGKGASVLDVTGLAQKNGPVTSHVRVAARPDQLHATRIAAGSADLVIGCDIVVAASPENLAKLSPARSAAVVNSHVAPTFEFATHPDLDLSGDPMRAALRAGAEACHFVDATRLATALLGDAIFTNPFLLGYALQKRRLPVSLAALERAIELNGRAIDANKRALAWGRLAAHDLAAVERAARAPGRDATPETDTLESLVARRSAFLTDYQDAAYAQRYQALVARVAAREREQSGEAGPLARAVAQSYAKLLAVKDEYEVARLYTDGEFRKQIDAEFEGDYRVVLHLAPPHMPVIDWLFDRREASTGRTKKIAFGSWIFSFLRVLARLKFLRGTPFDPFGRVAHRRLERQLARDYEARVEELCEGLSRDNLDVAIEIARLPEHVRGFESVKEQALEAVTAKQEELLASFRLKSGAAA